MANAVGPEEDLLPSIRQLITSVAPSLQAAGSLAAAEECLYHLEETDENFHRYEFVKHVRNKIEEVLGPLIEEKLENGDFNEQSKGSEDALIQIISSHVINDPTCIEMLQSLKVKTKDAVDRLVRAYDDDSRQTSSYQSAYSSSYDQRVMHSFSMSDDSSSLDSSFNQSAFLFMTQEHFVSIAENLEQGKPLEVRRDAMQSLLQIPPSDVVACEQWDALRSSLLAALGDEDDILADKSLRFHARMFSSNSHSVMREVYLSLVQHLSWCFSTNKSNVVLVRDGVDFADPDTEVLLKKFRLMNEFQIEAESFWIRFPERFLDEITEATFDLLVTSPTVESGMHQPLTPSHYLSVVDPKAIWFKTWMHGDYSRTAVIRLAKRNMPLVEDAVEQCLKFISSRTHGDAVTALSRRLDRQRIDTSTMRTHYTDKEVDFLYFYHCLSLLGRLLCYKNGRALFPVHLSGAVTLSASDFMLSLVQLVTDHLEPLHSPSSDMPFSSNCPADLVTETIKTLCTVESACTECLLKDSIVLELLKPIKKWLRHGKISSNCTMLHAADILSGIASWEPGKRRLLYGENDPKLNLAKSAPVHMIAEFCQQSLDSPTESDLQICPPKSVIAAYLSLCRQLYNNCEGLQVLYPYGLHHYVANAWREASRETEMGATPTMDEVALGSPRSTETSNYSALMWEQTLIDHLLNFAGTPKGLLLLQQTGAMNEAVAYMYSRYAKKLQVSKTEKFGYGFMVTQIANTAPGMMALENTGFIQALVHELWSILECGTDDQPSLGSNPHQAQSFDDRPAQKCFTRLANVLSSFSGVYELLANKPLANKDNYSFREVPDTIPDLLDRIVIVNSDVKSHFLFNQEQTQVFGLRLLSVMSTCLDSWLLLETQYKICEFLLDEQNSNRNDESGEIMIDNLSVERNHILVRSNVIGGPTERILPERSLSEGSGSAYPWRLFSSLPVPKSYSSAVPKQPSLKGDNQLSKFLDKKIDHVKPQVWMKECQDTFCHGVDTIPGKLMIQLLEKVLAVQLQLPDDYQAFPLKPCKVTDSTLKTHKLSNMQILGSKMTVRYGRHLKLLPGTSNVNESLMCLLKKCQYFLQNQRRTLDSEITWKSALQIEESKCIKSLANFIEDKGSIQSDYVGHDWFASTIFLLMSGNREKAWSFLHGFSSLLLSGYMWIPRLHASVHLPVELAISSIHPVFSTVCHHIELILQLELPQVFSAFRLSGFTPSQVCQNWLRQCFWNYLDWPEISLYIAICLVMGADYQVYFCVSIFKYLQPKVLLYTQQQQLQVFLKENNLEGYRAGEHLPFMRHLETKFRSLVLQDMQTLNKG